MPLRPKFEPGDRVLMLRHADWKAPAVATVTREGRPRHRPDGTPFLEYIITFDQLQADLTDEAAGLDNLYEQTTVMEEFLRPLDDRGPA